MTRWTVLGLVLSCAAAPGVRAETFVEERFELRSAWSNVAAPEVLVIWPTETRVDALAAWRPKLEAMAPETAPLFAKLDRHQKRAALGFWVGLVGMVGSIYYYEQRTPRTIGNVLWGTGWLGWLGYGALTEAGLEDVQRALDRRANGGVP